MLCIYLITNASKNEMLHLELLNIMLFLFLFEIILLVSSWDLLIEKFSDPNLKSSDSKSEHKFISNIKMFLQFNIYLTIYSYKLLYLSIKLLKHVQDSTHTNVQRILYILKTYDKFQNININIFFLIKTQQTFTIFKTKFN